MGAFCDLPSKYDIKSGPFWLDWQDKISHDFYFFQYFWDEMIYLQKTLRPMPSYFVDLFLVVCNLSLHGNFIVVSCKFNWATSTSLLKSLSTNLS